MSKKMAKSKRQAGDGKAADKKAAAEQTIEQTIEVYKQQLIALQVQRVQVAMVLSNIDNQTFGLIDALADLGALPQLDSNDWSELKMLPAADLLLTAFPAGLTSKEIADELVRRKVKTNAADVAGSVYATLKSHKERYSYGPDFLWRKRIPGLLAVQERRASAVLDMTKAIGKGS